MQTSSPGILVINKPVGMTSHDVVDAIRRCTGERRVGHAGTLDPLASGVLIVGVGRPATKLLGIIGQRTIKTYRATVRFGAESDTYDAEGTITERENVRPIKKSELTAALATFRGTIQQVPPVYSSIKQGGESVHKKVRRGEAVTLEPRSITIHDLRVIAYAWPDCTLTVTCSSGTYIRSLAHDLGDKLGVGGYLIGLERTAVGEYTLAQAATLGDIEADVPAHMLPLPKNLQASHDV